MLAEGLSGAAIADRLVLSPETIRTHVRNAMEKLGAATRSQAVAIALGSGAIGDGEHSQAPERKAAPAPAEAPATRATLTALLAGVVSLADVESGAIYLAEDGGMVLRLAASAADKGVSPYQPPAEVSLGEAGIGRVALERRARLVSLAGAGSGAVLASPMSAAGRLAGVLALGVRQSRPTSRRELLLIEAFANRVAEILANGGEPTALSQAFKRFRASWTETLVG